MRADEVNRRLATSDRMVRLRTRLTNDGAGELRGIVSTSHEAIADSDVVAALAKSIDGLPTRVARVNVTDRSTTVVAYLGDDQDAGSIVGRMRSAFMLRNSDVGYASLLGVAQVVRVVCTNGMTAPVANAKVFRRRHVGITAESIESVVRERLDELPEVYGFNPRRPTKGPATRILRDVERLGLVVSTHADPRRGRRHTDRYLLTLCPRFNPRRPTKGPATSPGTKR